MSEDLATGLIELARMEARSPEGRERLIESLSVTLQTVAGDRCIIVAPPPMLQAVHEAVFDLSAALILAGDRFEWIAERLTASPSPGC